MTFIQFISSLIVAAIIIIITMINVIALWKLFKKADKLGWTSLIPFYNIFVLFIIIGMNPWWLCIIFVIYFLQNFLFFYIPAFNLISFVLFPFTLFSIITIWYVIICSAIDLCRCFKKDNSFLIGLIFMPYIFFPILIFSNDSYIGPNPIDDFIFPSKNKISNITYCLGCGKKITDNSMKFCTNCGNSLIQEKLNDKNA